MRVFKTPAASPTRAESADFIIGAFLSVLIAITLSALLIPTRCCIAPDIPKAIYNFGETELPV